jgi:hypothetical protein
VAVRIAALMILIGILSTAIGQDVPASLGESKAIAVPALPFYDWGSCPYAGCAHRELTAHRSVTVYDTWKKARRPITQLVKGNKVALISGFLATFKPGLIRMDRDLPDRNLQRGDIVLTYAYRGEGYSAAWFKGTYYSELDISFAKWPDGSGCGGEHCAATYIDLGTKSWWAEVKLNSGRTGWVEMDTAQIPLSLY